MGLRMISPRRVPTLYLAAAAASVIVLSAAPAQAFSINDNADTPSGGGIYWGGDTHSFGDVISNTPTDTTSAFEIKGVNAFLGGPGAQDLIVQVFTNYNPMTSEPGAPTSYGDLFLTPSADYKPAGDITNNWSTDTFASGQTDWKYALAIGATSGTSMTVFQSGVDPGVGVYAVDENNIYTSYYPSPGVPIPSNVTIRDGEPVQYNTTGEVSA